jgi:SAM-dependent methyltransferase
VRQLLRSVLLRDEDRKVEIAPDAKLEAWRAEERHPFTGWDFSHLYDRWTEEHPPWSYADLARDTLRGARSAVDLGTGGGERLSALVDAFPVQMFATEAYPPNQAIARRRLEPLGVTVVAYESADVVGGPLPFADGSLDVVLDRHESYDAREVARVLAPGGRFLTQQVDGRDKPDLLALFGLTPAYPEVALEPFVAAAEAAGLVIERAEEWWGDSVFADIGALVYYVKATGTVPDFSVARYETVLRGLEERLRASGALRFRCGRFVLAARKPVA